MQFLDKVVNSVVVQRLVTGCDRAENCGGSAVACYDKVVDVPVVQFIDGLDVPVIMQRRRSRDSEGATDSVHRQSRGHSCRNRDGSAPSVYGGDEGFFRGFSAFFALLRVVPELSASFRSPRRRRVLRRRGLLHNETVAAC